MTTATTCPFCHSAASHHVTAFEDQLAQCPTCKLIFLAKHPTTGEMIARHQTREYAEHPYFQAETDAAASGGIPLHDEILQLLRDRLPPRARLLDVGCGTGSFLQAAKRDFQVAGIEPAPLLAEQARARTGASIFVGKPEDYPLDEPFDAVVLLDVIEHAADPRELLREARRLLRPDGLLVISTIDSRSLLYRLGPLLGFLSRRSKFAKYVLHRIYCRQHNWYFNRHVLRQLVEQHGFQTQQHVGFEYPLNRLRESKLVVAGLSLLFFVQRLMRAKSEQYLIAGRVDRISRSPHFGRRAASSVAAT